MKPIIETLRRESKRYNLGWGHHFGVSLVDYYKVKDAYASYEVVAPLGETSLLVAPRYFTENMASLSLLANIKTTTKTTSFLSLAHADAQTQSDVANDK